jgi:hypothetical protein
MSSFHQDLAIKVIVNNTKEEIFKLIYDLCRHEIDKTDSDLREISFGGNFVTILQLLWKRHEQIVQSLGRPTKLTLVVGLWMT